MMGYYARCSVRTIHCTRSIYFEETTMGTLFFVLLSVVFSSFLISEGRGRKLSKKVDLRAVTYFANIRGFYNIIKTQKPLVQPKDLKADVKKNICRNILSSHYFQTFADEDWVDVDDERIRVELANNPKASSSMFKLRMSTRKMIKRPEYVHEDTNIYRALPIYVNDDHEDEFVFKCLTKDRESQELKEYFVSREYDVAANEVDAYPIAGRFIFSRHPLKFLVIRALAEEVAECSKHSEYGLAEFRYSKRRRDSGPTKTPEQDPICKLEQEEQLRLCAILFGSVTFRDKVEFSPTIDNIQLPCERRQISFMASISATAKLLLKLTGRSLTGNRNYEEWTIGCKAITADRKEEITYFVSRGDDRNTIFVYTRRFSDGKIFVDNYLRNVSVVGGVKEEDVRIKT